MSLTLYDKIWSAHVVANEEPGVDLLYIDRQLLHEVSSPQAFEILREKGIQPRRPEAQLGLADHAVPTRHRDRPIADPLARAQVDRHAANCFAFGIRYLELEDVRQGIVHVVGPEQGFTLPGMTLVCGDSHTATQGAFGALAFGIGASEVGCVLATQTLRQRKAKRMRVTIDGKLGPHVSAKDLILAIVGRLGAAGATGHAIEYAGSTVRGLSMEARMTLCNMSIEAGSRTGLIAPDDICFEYLSGRPMAPAGSLWDAALADWRALASDDEATFDSEIAIDATALEPQVSWGTSPDQVTGIGGAVPEPTNARARAALDYMGLVAGTPLDRVAIDHVFIGSCTNGRIEDLRAAAAILAGRTIADGVQAIVVPGSGLVKRQAEREGLDTIFRAAGFEWRDAGCSLCVAMNDDRLQPGERCASTSNRNFEGRQGIGARTHLMSPAMAAAAAVTGRLSDVRRLAC
ncbi:3-isopropylmalate dehydratase large subunit [Sphingomonas sp. CGMCC 1.13654]|uniref:3-isopropylmalate dehydratase large subunit n=1 Tax=Sphingomonas chungangi TaxID=2683589 RepID=A0A838L8E3_9SPHN|nr:3-isopropylmalate dehydratase large subunit [Sphingomonas chungangi]MBA2934819.1 3-isopropylmalate dehydratase large subunit [Sphingomonas chungangi]MVW58130.1 3-isopropylmalate dehydratase large subunit [Sphingomonas chungangi]